MLQLVDLNTRHRFDTMYGCSAVALCTMRTLHVRVHCTLSRLENLFQEKLLRNPDYSTTFLSTRAIKMTTGSAHISSLSHQLTGKDGRSAAGKNIYIFLVSSIVEKWRLMAIPSRTLP